MEDEVRLHLYLLGHFRLEDGQGPIRLSTRKVELLLAYLALHPQSHTRDKLATLNWGDFSEAQAKASLRNALATLRKQGGDDLLLADRETVQLNPLYGVWVDALEFQAQATAFLAESLPDPTSLKPELYQGELLTDFDADWLLTEREHYHALYQDALLRLIQQLRVRGEYVRAIKLAEQLLAHEPTNEPAHQHLMFCYLAIGERHKALKQYESCLRLLREELGVDPQPETVALYQHLKKSAPSASAPELLWTNLPNPLTSFVGRELQVAEIKGLLQTPTPRLLTLVGPGGGGKTRLAIQVARQVAGLFEAGVWWVELAPVAEPAFVPQAVAKVLSIRESSGQPFLESLSSYLRSRQALVVLDNCEHLIIACAQLAEALLQACPQLQILATSREALGMTGEHLWPVPSLAVPEPSLRLEVDELKAYEAIQLFTERARAIRPDFRLTPQNGPILAQICQRLDGIPLALELAAARIKLLPPGQIAARLDDRFNLLTGGNRAALPRQQTLRATMDWSYELLEAEEQRLFRQLSIFAGSFTLEAVEAICIPEEARQPRHPLSVVPTLHRLSRLVDKSLVMVEIEEEGEARYRLLETIRQYGGDLLWLSHEEVELRHRHLSWFAQLTEQAEPGLLGAQQMVWLERLERDYPNLSSALRWSVEGAPVDIEAGLRLGGALWRFWDLRGYISEGREQLGQLLALPGAKQYSEAYAKALFSAGMLALYQMDSKNAINFLEESRALWQQLQHKSGLALSLQHLGFIAHRLGRPDLARTRYEESLALWRALGESWGLAETLGLLGNLAYWEKDYPLAHSLQAESLQVKRQLGEKRGIAFSVWSMGKIATAQGDYLTARSLFQEALTTMSQLEDKGGIPFVLEAFGYLAVAEGQFPQAAQLLGAAETLREAAGSVLPSISRADHERDIDQIRSQLGSTSFATAWAAGRAMSLEEAVAYALQSGGIIS